MITPGIILNIAAFVIASVIDESRSVTPSFKNLAVKSTTTLPGLKQSKSIV